MKICLVNICLDLRLACESSKSFTTEAEITFSPDLQECDSDIYEGEDKYIKFKSHFDREFGEAKWPITITFNMSNISVPPGEEPLKKWDIKVESDILDAIHKTLYHGSHDEALKMELLADCTYNDPYGITGDMGRMKAEDFLPEKREDGSVSHCHYEQKGVILPGVLTALAIFNRIGYARHNWNLTLQISGSAFICLADILPKLSDTNRKIFTDRKFCDFEIISEDGTSIPCHKIFICAKSQVLTNMLEGSFKEATENKLTLRHKSTRGITALLEYIYCNDVHQAFECCNVALELLQAADEYDIPVLWKTMQIILMEKSHVWYDVDAALSLFEFVNNCKREGSQEIMKKMIRVLALKPEQLSKSSLYKEMFSSKVSREMFNVALEGNKE